MDIQKIRYDNMLRLKGTGSLADLANRIESTPNYFYQIKASGGRAMGTSIARRLEAEFGKERGWMDIPHADDGDGDEPFFRTSETSINPNDSDKRVERDLKAADEELVEYRRDAKTDESELPSAASRSASQQGIQEDPVQYMLSQSSDSVQALIRTLLTLDQTNQLPDEAVDAIRVVVRNLKPRKPDTSAAGVRKLQNEG